MKSAKADEHDVQIFSVDASTWHVVEPLANKLEPSMCGSFTTEEHRAALEANQIHAWAAAVDGTIKGLILLAVDETPTGRRSLVVRGVAGYDLAEWYEVAMAMIVAFQKTIGADVLYSVCRPGMARFLSRRGWRSTKYTVMEYIDES